MTMRLTLMTTALLVTASPLLAQTTNDPFPSPIPSTEGVIRVDFVEFASIPDIDGSPARMMRLVDEPGTGRIFVNDMRGPIYSVSYDGRTVTEYVDIDDPDWEVAVQSRGRERASKASRSIHSSAGPAPRVSANSTHGRTATIPDRRPISRLPATAMPTTRSFSNGLRGIPAAPATTAARRGNSYGFNNRSGTTTVVRSASVLLRLPARPTSVCFTSPLPTEAAGATRSTTRRTSPRPSGSYFESTRSAPIAPTASTESLPETRLWETQAPWAKSTPTEFATPSVSAGTG